MVNLTLEDLDVDRKPKKCRTLEEFFDLPAAIMPIISMARWLTAMER